MNKNSRQFTIKEIIMREPIGNQEDLGRALKKKGVEVTQATLSRDLKEMGVIRMNTSSGPQYAIPASGEDARLKMLLSYEIKSIEHNEALVIIRTLAGRAQGVAEQIDAMQDPEILATIAGDNTVFVAPRTVKNIERLVKSLRAFIATE